MSDIQTIVISEDEKRTDIYKYIRSEEIRNYLRENHYHFSLLQAVYLICHNLGTALAVKHKDLKALIREYEDSDFRPYSGQAGSLHKAIEHIVEQENKYLDLFYEEDGLFSFGVEELDCLDRVHSSLDEVIENIGNYIERAAELNIIRDDPVVHIRKQYTDKPLRIDVFFDRNMVPLGVDASGATEDPEPDFYFCYEAIPLPFERGDIIRDLSRPWDENSNVPMIITDDNLEAKKFGKAEKIIGRYDPEYIDCCFICKGSLVTSTVPATCIEYWKGEESEEYRCLCLIQDMIRGHIRTGDFLSAFPAMISRLKSRIEYEGKYVLRRERYSGEMFRSNRVYELINVNEKEYEDFEKEALQEAKIKI
ncbi:MAG: hypothetical protein IKD94_03255 [Erysipelotrichaceae bacterium]|nr:hypothetical protein [Erysipelotrichaceae bacterium]